MVIRAELAPRADASLLVGMALPEVIPDPLPEADRESHEAAADRVMALIRQLNLKPADRLPSERELMRAWGMSHYAVNRAVRGLVSAGLLRREGYRLHPVAAPNRRKVAAPHVILPYDPQGPATASAEARLWDTQVISLGDRFQEGRQSVESMVADLIDGPCHGLLIRLYSVTPTLAELLRKLQARGTPVVTLGQAVAGLPGAIRDREGGFRDLLEHLRGQGHEQVACLVRPPYEEHEVEIASYQAACRSLGLAASAARVVRCPADHAPSVIEALRGLTRGRRPATAVLAVDGEMAVAVARAAPHLRLELPRDLSLISVGEYMKFAPLDQFQVSPALSFQPTHDPDLTRAAMALLLDLMWQRFVTGRVSARPWLMQFRSVLESRASVAAAPGGAGAARPTPSEPAASAGRWSLERKERARQLAAHRAQAHPLTQGVRNGDFLPLELGGLVNRSTHGGRGWLGAGPLLHFEPGRHSIHGVPFHVVPARRKRDGAGYVALRHFSLSWRRELALPEQVSIPVDRRVRAVWMLHGCGFVRGDQPCATYRFIEAGSAGRTWEIPLTPLAYAPSDPRELAAAEKRANIQDWFPAFPQFSNDRARAWVVCEDDDPLRYERYLYTLQWTAPGEGVELARIELTVQPGTVVALGLLASTVLLAEEKTKPRSLRGVGSAALVFDGSGP